MPSRFPWSSKTDTSSDHHLENPRSASRQQVIYPPQPTPTELSYDPYSQNQQAYQSTTSFGSASSPPASSPSGGFVPPPLSEQNYTKFTSDQEQFGPPPVSPGFPPQQQQRALLAKPQPPSTKKSLRSKLLGVAVASRDEVDHSKDAIFGRRKSIRRKEPPNLDTSVYQQQQQQQQHQLQQVQQQQQQQQQQDPRVAPQWAQPEQPGTVRARPQQHPYGTYDQEYPSEEIDSQAFFPHPTEPTLNPQQHLTQDDFTEVQDSRGPYLNYSRQPGEHLQQQAPPQFQLYRDTAPDSPIAQNPETSRTSFESFPQPPSRPDSRPISRQSFGRNPSIVSQGSPLNPSDQYQTAEGRAFQQTADSPQQISPQQSLASGSGQMGPLSGQRPQQQRSAESSKMSPPGQLIRENSALHPGSSAGADGNSQSAQKSTQQTTQDGELRSRTPPPPPRSATDMSEAEINQLIRDHREMKQKYNNVKRQYFDKRDQVDSLQNTLAHQRIIQSRTQWDDGEYITRMTRLDGLISQLAFGMRKDWKTMPEWLQPYTNKDALQVAKQEMTAVGRAYISRWLADELFDKYFHPGLEEEISTQLKTIQRNIREYAPPAQSSEEEEALHARIVNWRLATVDGLQPALTSQDAMTNRRALTQELNQRLVKDIEAHMSDPPPIGLDGGVHMIIELAVTILGNLPLESRDVRVAYYPPGYPVSTDLMKVETGIPVLPGSTANQETTEGDQASTHSTASGNVLAGENVHDADLPSSHDGKIYEEHTKRGFFGSLVGGSGSAAAQKRNASPARGYQGKLGNNPSAAASQNSLPQGTPVPREDRVRMCVFLGTQIRGKMVLVKAPIYRV